MLRASPPASLVRPRLRTAFAVTFVRVLALLCPMPARGDCQDGAVFTESIVAVDKNAFSWSTPTDIDFVKGDLGQLPTYTTWIRGTRIAATFLDVSQDNPASGQAVFYLIKASGSPCGSWQNPAGAEPNRDTRIQIPCSQLQPTHDQITEAVGLALDGVNDPWTIPADFMLVYKRIQNDLGCAIEEAPEETLNAAVKSDCSTVDCDTTYCCLDNYCGVSHSHSGFGITWPAGQCFNEACFTHDACSKQRCVWPGEVGIDGCYFSPQSISTGCDNTLFAAWSSCPQPPVAGITDDIIYTIASTLNLRSAPWCNDAPCLNGSCNPATGVCDCNDQNPCSDDQSGYGGVCTHSFSSAGASCGSTSNTPCDHPDTCDGQGTCQPNKALAGTACDDGDACTVNTQCQADGSCAGIQRDCNDNNPCTADSCDPASGCVNSPIADCAPPCGEEYAVDANTIALYHLNDSSVGVVQDSVGNHDGTLYGDAHIGSGYFGSGLLLDGAGDYVRLGNVHHSPARVQTAGTVELWVKLTAAPNYFVILGSGREYGGTWDDGWFLGRHWDYGHDLVFGIWGNSLNWQYAHSGIDPGTLVGSWHHIAGTWGPRGVELWLDGHRIATNPFTGGLPNADYQTALVGTDSWTWATPGELDEVRISDIQRDFSTPCTSTEEHIIVPTNGSVVTSATTLQNGVNYQLRASGVFFVGGPCANADADYYLCPAPEDIVNCDDGPWDSGIGINSSGNTTTKYPSWGPYDPSHVYTINFVGQGAPINLRYHDCSSVDNSGSLTVDILQPTP